MSEDVRDRLVSLATAIGYGSPEANILDEAALHIDQLRAMLKLADDTCKRAAVAMKTFERPELHAVVGVPAPEGTTDSDAYKMLRSAIETYRRGVPVPGHQVP